MQCWEVEELLGPLNETERKFAPQQLWTAGDAELLRCHPRVAVVGTRKPSADGVRRARKLVAALVQADAIVVSGLAEGIDTVAHTHTITLAGRTVAVLGTPLDQSFPATNRALQRQLAAEHLVVSEFAPGRPSARGNFPRRNRTMALLSDATVIIEAGEGSGTISQGWEALRLGRPLFLLRSLVESSLAWPREMVQYGAFELRQAEDLLSVLPRTQDLRAVVSF